MQTCKASRMFSGSALLENEAMPSLQLVRAGTQPRMDGGHFQTLPGCWILKR